jgi:hypothetical protein
MNFVDALGLGPQGSQCRAIGPVCQILQGGLPGGGGDGGTCSLDGGPTPCSLVSSLAQSGALNACAGSVCAPLEPVATGSGLYQANIQFPGVATTAYPCSPAPWECSSTPPIIEAYAVLSVTLDLGMAGTFYPGGKSSAGLTYAQGLRIIANGVVKGAGPIGNPAFPIIFWTTSALGGGTVAAGPEIYAGLLALGDTALGQVLAHPVELGEFLDAATAELPVVTSGASAAGTLLNIGRTIACKLQGNDPWYCFGD